MEKPNPQSGPVWPRAFSRRWQLALVVTAVAHGWATLALFGAQPWTGLTDDRPLLSGRHALHLYHGFLGAQTFKNHGRTLCYDPAVYAGYPKTPWLDANSKPAELALWIGGGGFRPAAYKLGVAMVWFLLPLLLPVAAASMRWELAAGCTAAWLGAALCWSDLGRSMLWAGDVDLLLAAGLTVVHAALLSAHSRQPSFALWLGLLFTGWGMVFCQPGLLAVVLVLGAFCCLHSAGRHSSAWYLGLVAVLGLSAAGNAWWLRDAVAYWWIQVDSPGSASLPLLFLRAAGRWSLFTVIFALALPLAHAARWLIAWLSRRQVLRLAAFALSAMFMALPIAAFYRETANRTLPIGLPPSLTATTLALEQATTSDARILWEEAAATDDWTPLLPVLTGRPFVGGLGRPAAIEHAAGRLRDGLLAGRYLANWTDAELAEYCRRYNIGWIACRTAAVAERLQRWPAAEALPPLPNGDSWFVVHREPSYFLVGGGKVRNCDAQGLTLTDLQPVNGFVVLSFHSPPRVWAASKWVRIEKEPQMDDAIPFLRLRLAEPMTRLTLYWNGE